MTPKPKRYKSVKALVKDVSSKAFYRKFKKMVEERLSRSPVRACKFRLWSGVYKDTGEIAPNIWLNKKTARYNLGPHMRVIEVKLCPIQPKRRKK
mgnify:CR=1 FL=1